MAARTPRRRVPGGRWVALVCVLACGGEPRDPVERPVPEVDALAFDTVEEIQTELDILSHEIADLEAVLARDTPAARVAAAVDPHTLLEHARRARGAAERGLAAGDLAGASDSLIAAAGHIEEVKRTLGLAEEWGF